MGFEKLRSEYPDMHVYVSYGERAGDNFSIPAIPASIGNLKAHNKWDIFAQGGLILREISTQIWPCMCHEGTLA